MTPESDDVMLISTSSFLVNHSGDTTLKIPTDCVVLESAGDFVPWENPDNLIKRTVTETWERIIHGVLLPLLFLVSIPTNALNMAVFVKHGLKERINLCLFCLSLADFIYIFQSLCLYADRIYNELTCRPLQGPLSEFMMNNNIIGLYGFCWASSWMSTIIACERCFCVVSPLRAHTVLQTKTMAVVITVSFVVLVGGYFVATSKWNVVCVFDPQSNSTYPAIYPSRFFQANKEVVDTLDAVAYGVVVPQFCIAVVTACTVVTALRLGRLARWRERSSSGSAADSTLSRDVSLTRMLIGTSVLYVVSFLPGLLLRFTMLGVKQLSLGGRYYNTYRLAKLTVMLASYINSSFNFFIYYMFGSKFRHTLKREMCRGSLAKKKGLTDTEHSAVTSVQQLQSVVGYSYDGKRQETDIP